MQRVFFFCVCGGKVGQLLTFEQLWVADEDEWDGMAPLRSYPAPLPTEASNVVIGTGSHIFLHCRLFFLCRYFVLSEDGILRYYARDPAISPNEQPKGTIDLRLVRALVEWVAFLLFLLGSLWFLLRTFSVFLPLALNFLLNSRAEEPELFTFACVAHKHEVLFANDMPRMFLILHSPYFQRDDMLFLYQQARQAFESNYDT